MFQRTALALTAAVASAGLLLTSAAPATALPDWRTDRTTRPAAGDARAPKVLDLRFAEHRRFDRVVVDMRGMRPGYTIDYTRRLHQEGSGRVVRLPGRQKMFLSLTPAEAHDARGRTLYEGPRRQRTGFDTLRGVALLGDFEGAVTFGFGLDRRAPYRIFTLAHPRRIVVDFQH